MQRQDSFIEIHFFFANFIIVVLYQVENLHKVAEFSIIICLDSSRENEKTLKGSKRKTLLVHLSMAVNDFKQIQS